VLCNDHFRGRLFIISASLLFFLSREILKWQYPINAAGEKLAFLVATLRSVFLPASPQAARR
jgi:hypothetical protein